MGATRAAWGGTLLALALAHVAAAAAAGAHAGGSAALPWRKLLQTDYVGKDPRGADTRGADVVGSDPIGLDPLGGGRGRPASPSPSPEPSPSPSPTAGPSPSPAPAAPAAAPAAAGGCRTAAEILQANPNTTIFWDLAQAGGLAEYLSDPGKLFMVFAPDNIAWNSFFEGFKINQEQLKSDPELLGALLNYHVVPDRALNESQWTAALSLPTRAPGESLAIRVPGGTDANFYVQGAPGYLLGVVLQADVPACSGSIVDVIGGVMISDAVDQLLMKRGLVGG